MDPRPPCRTTHIFADADTGLIYDRWGSGGRPVILLHGLLFDRTLWWPVGAELAAVCTVIAPDLPGHGETPLCRDCAPERIAGTLAALVHSLGLPRAPVVVGHATSVYLAETFADLFATHAVLAIDEARHGLEADVDSVVAAAGLADVPPQYQPFAQPRRDPTLLRAYRLWSERPPAREAVVSARRGHAGVTGPRFTPLSDPEGVAAKVHSLL